MIVDFNICMALLHVLGQGNLEIIVSCEAPSNFNASPYRIMWTIYVKFNCMFFAKIRWWGQHLGRPTKCMHWFWPGGKTRANQTGSVLVTCCAFPPPLSGCRWGSIPGPGLRPGPNQDRGRAWAGGTGGRDGWAVATGRRDGHAWREKKTRAGTPSHVGSNH